jgi:beta-carotene/zeaxanthin 4-ketolase
MKLICMRNSSQSPPLTGLWVAAVIMVLWVSSLDFLLFLNLDRLTFPLILAAILGRTFIQTGLFIVAHDAIHGTVLPSTGAASPTANRSLNDAIGQLAVALYALLPYQKLAANHRRHHHHPGQVNDPDFHDGVHRSLLAWYMTFMGRYLDGQQQIVEFFGIGAIFSILHWGFHAALPNLFLFWILPIVLSSMQLFFFGTYLPHRRISGSETSHQIISSPYSPILSFLTCYHFGYHWEHHEYPYLPWYRLPFAYYHKPDSAATVDSAEEQLSANLCRSTVK